MSRLHLALLLGVFSCGLTPIAVIAQDAHDAQGLTDRDRRQAFLDLTGSLRLLCVAVAPGDENAALLARYRRGQGVQTAIAWVTCGEAGDDVVVAERGDALRVRRMEESRAAARMLGADTFFLHLPDSGPTPSREETLAIWGEETLRERLVRAIRRFRPHVVLLASASERDGRHAAVLEVLPAALRDAADRQKFDDHLEALLYPWQARRLFAACPPTRATVAVEVNAIDPVDGVSWAELGARARACHESRGLRRLQSAELEPAVPCRQIVPAPAEGGAPGIDIPAGDVFEGLLGYDREELELRKEEDFRRVAAVEQKICAVGRRLLELSADDAAGIELLADVLGAINELNARPFASRELAPGEWFDEKGYQDFFRRRTNQLSRAMRHWLRIGVAVTVDAPRPVAPGERFPVDVKVTTASGLAIGNLGVRLQPSATFAKTYVEQRNRELTRERPVFAYFKARVLEQAEPTLPKARHYRGLEGFGPTLRAEIGGRVRDQLFVFTVGIETPDVVPAVELRAKPARVLRRLAAMKEGGETVEVEFLTRGPLDFLGGRPEGAPVRFRLRAETASGVAIEPASIVIENERAGTVSAHRFRIAADRAVTGVVVTFRAQAFGKEPDTFAGPEFTTTVPVDVIECRVASGRRVGVIAGNDRALVTGLGALGLEPRILDGNVATALERSGRDSELDTVFVGTDALAALDGFQTLAGPLLAFVEGGGVLVYLGQRSGARSARTAPLPAVPCALDAGGPCIGDAAAAVTLLRPDHPLLAAPNRIDASAFEGWVSERGRNFPASADPRFVRLLAVAKAGGGTVDTGLLVVEHGKGAVICTALALAPQLDAAVPGAIRLLANLAAFRPEKGS